MTDTPFELVDIQDPYHFGHSDWFQHCRKTGSPFVLVRRGEQTADVLWDFVTLPVACDALLRERLSELDRDARAIFERHATEESFLRVKPTLIGFDRLPYEQATLAATALHDLIARYLPLAWHEDETEAETEPAADTAHWASTEETTSTEPRALWVEALDASSPA